MIAECDLRFIRLQQQFFFYLPCMPIMSNTVRELQLSKKAKWRLSPWFVLIFSMLPCYFLHTYSIIVFGVLGTGPNFGPAKIIVTSVVSLIGLAISVSACFLLPEVKLYSMCVNIIFRMEKFLLETYMNKREL